LVALPGSSRTLAWSDGASRPNANRLLARRAGAEYPDGFCCRSVCPALRFPGVTDSRSSSASQPACYPCFQGLSGGPDRAALCAVGVPGAFEGSVRALLETAWRNCLRLDSAGIDPFLVRDAESR